MRTCLRQGRFRLVVLPFFLPFLLSVSLSFSILIAPAFDTFLDFVVWGNMGRNVKETRIFPFDEGLCRVERWQKGVPVILGSRKGVLRCLRTGRLILMNARLAVN